MWEPLVSVITATYNIAPFINQSVESALSQTWTNLEVIVVDDGSSDDTARCLRGIGDHRLRCYFQTHQGQAAVINTGIAAAQGSYIAFLDGDDLWMPTKIETHLRSGTSRGTGFQEIRVRGSHSYLRHPDGRRTVAPMRAGETIGVGLLPKIPRDN